MRRYKIVACILLTLSIFSYVLAAPVATQEVREACADAVDDGDDVIIRSWKRAEDEDQLLAQEPSSLPSSSEGEAKLIQPESSTETLPVSSSNAKKVKWAPTMEVQLPSGLTYNQMLPPEDKPEPSTEIQSASSSDAKSVAENKPGTSTEIQSASSGNAKSAGWVAKEVKLPSGLIYSELVPADNEPHPEPESTSILTKLVESAKTWLGKG